MKRGPLQSGVYLFKLQGNSLPQTGRLVTGNCREAPANFTTLYGTTVCLGCCMCEHLVSYPRLTTCSTTGLFFDWLWVNCVVNLKEYRERSKTDMIVSFSLLLA